MSTVFMDEEVSHRILSIINDAKKFVVIVTPYVGLWGHAKNAVQLAVKRGVNVFFLMRNDPDVVRGSDIQWLVDNQVGVLILDRLHAKIYFNESTLITSSMNLTESSTKESLEIGTLVTDPDEAKVIRDYVTSTLIPLAKLFGQHGVSSKVVAGSRNLFAGAPTTARSARAVGKTGASRARAKGGFCIRCGAGVSLDVERPLCGGCYDTWAEYGNVDYPEAVCHYCGIQAAVSYAKPLCPACYRASAQ